jgi:diguanylate cyclase (GGDEF)-like protein
VLAPVTTPVTITPPVTTPILSSPLLANALTLAFGRRSAGRSAGAASSSSRGAALLAANPLTVPLAPATAGLGARSAATAAAATTGRHRGQRVRVIVERSPSSPGTVISRFIAVIPTAIWIALAVSFGLAMAGGGAAVAFGRRARRHAGEVATVTTAAITDQLTGVLNRRGFTASAERELERARRYEHPLALAYVDVRGLKAVNDTEGHLAGDELLKEVAVLLTQSARTHDLVGRLGGDELVVLLAEQAEPGAGAVTRRIRAKIPSHRAALGLSTDWDVTIGTSVFPNDGDTLEELLAAADRRLYQQRGIELKR